MDAVWRGAGLPVRSERIFDAMYEDDPDGGHSPQRMYATMKESMVRMKQKLEGSGISIENAGYRAGFRLVLGNKSKGK